MIYDVIVIGGGQAGLSIGYYLNKTKINLLILDAGKKIGHSWRNRYDSLVFFSPRSYDSPAGMGIYGESDKYPNKDDLAKYLEDYTIQFNLQVLLNTKVVSLEKNHDNN